jgi:hypothetical protein
MRKERGVDCVRVPRGEGGRGGRREVDDTGEQLSLLCFSAAHGLQHTHPNCTARAPPLPTLSLCVARSLSCKHAIHCAWRGEEKERAESHPGCSLLPVLTEDAPPTPPHPHTFHHGWHGTHHNRQHSKCPPHPEEGSSTGSNN